MQGPTHVPPTPAAQHPQTWWTCTPASLQDGQQQSLGCRFEQWASGLAAGENPHVEGAQTPQPLSPT